MKKILTIVALSLVAIMGAAVISLVFIKQDHNQISLSNIEYVDVYYGTKHNNYAPEQEIFKTLLKKYASGTKESVLNTLFQGAYSAEAKAEIIKSGWSFSPTTGKNYLMLEYKEDHLPTLKLNGKTYEDETLTTEEKTVAYERVYITVENNTVLTKITVLVSEKNTSGTKTSGNYKIEFITHNSALYDYFLHLDEIDELK